jgi:hypothetical protein
MAIAELVVWNWSIYREAELLMEAANFDPDRLHGVTIDEGALAQVEVHPRPGDILEEGARLAVTLTQLFTVIYRDIHAGWLVWCYPGITQGELLGRIAQLHAQPASLEQPHDQVVEMVRAIRLQEGQKS